TGNPAVIVPHGFREAQGPTVAQIASGAGFGGRGASPSGAPASTPGSAPSDTAARRSQPQPSTPPEPRPQTPVSITFLGPLYQEENPLLLAHAFQQATDFHRKRPPGF